MDENGIKHFSNITSQEAGDTTILPEISTTREIPPPQDPPDDSRKASFQALPTATEPDVNITFVYYEVEAKTYRELDKKTSEKSPILYEGKIFRGNTQANTSYEYVTHQRNELWYVERVSATVDVTFTMPKWIDYNRARWADQKKWDRYYNALMAHENNHKDIAVAAAKRLIDAVIQIEATRDRAALDRKISRIAQSIFEQSSESNRAYDRKTDHGRTEGVVF